MNILPNIFRLVRHIKTNEGYKKVSEWQLAEDVECSDGKTAEAKLNELSQNVSEVKGSSAAIDSRMNGLTQTISGIKSFKSVFMTSSAGNITDCDDLPIGYTGYTYGDTLNTPRTGAWLVFCYGANDMYRAQIAIPLGGGALASRARQASGWGKWYNASLTVM